jgi:hypothetical protein
LEREFHIADRAGASAGPIAKTASVIGERQVGRAAEPPEIIARFAMGDPALAQVQEEPRAIWEIAQVAPDDLLSEAIVRRGWIVGTIGSSVALVASQASGKCQCAQRQRQGGSQRDFRKNVSPFHNLSRYV